MLSARQLLLMRRARDRAIDIAIAPLGTVILLPDPDFRRRVCGCVSHVGLALIAQWVRRMDRAAIVACPIMVVGVVMLLTPRSRIRFLRIADRPRPIAGRRRCASAPASPAPVPAWSAPPRAGRSRSRYSRSPRRRCGRDG